MQLIAYAIKKTMDKMVLKIFKKKIVELKTCIFSEI